MTSKYVGLFLMILNGQKSWSTGGGQDTKTDQALFLVEFFLEINLSYVIIICHLSTKP